MNIEAIVKPHFLSECTKIYHGLDHCCRCGCGGNYFEPGTRGFTRAINQLRKIDYVHKGADVYTHDGRKLKGEGIDYGPNYVNIPVDGDRDKCYCLYFDYPNVSVKTEKI